MTEDDALKMVASMLKNIPREGYNWSSERDGAISRILAGYEDEVRRTMPYLGTKEADGLWAITWQLRKDIMAALTKAEKAEEKNKGRR